MIVSLVLARMALAVADYCLAGVESGVVACVLARSAVSARPDGAVAAQQSREFMAGDRTLQSSREVPKAPA